MPRTVLAVALLLAACGAPAAQGTGANTAASGSGAGAGSGSDCHEETPTGTNIPHVVCRSSEQSQDERDAAQRYMKTVPTSPPVGR